MCSFWWDWYWIGRSQRFCFPSCPHVCSWPISWVDSCKVQRAWTAPQIWGRYSVIQKHLQIKFPPLYGFAIIQPWLLNSSCRINWPPCEKKKKKLHCISLLFLPKKDVGFLPFYSFQVAKQREIKNISLLVCSGIFRKQIKRTGLKRLREQQN